MKTVAIVLGALVALGILFFIGLHVYVYLGLWIAGIRLRRSLASVDRVMSIDEAKNAISNGRGMILVDAPTLGWNIWRVWWAPTSNFTERPESWDDDRMCPDADLQNFDRFIDDGSGCAKLIEPFLFGDGLRRFLRRHFGVDECPFVFSAGVDFERTIKNNKAESGPPGD